MVYDRMACMGARNKRIFEGVLRGPGEVLREAEEMLADYERYTDVVTVPTAPAASTEERRKWVKPAEGYAKFNCDASVSSTNRSGIGVICKDDSGSFLFGGQREIEFTEDIEVAEAECPVGVDAGQGTSYAPNTHGDGLSSACDKVSTGVTRKGNVVQHHLIHHFFS